MAAEARPTAAMRYQRLKAAPVRAAGLDHLAIFGMLAGFADSLQILGYLAGTDPSYFSLLAIGCKLFLLPFWDYRYINKNGIFFIVILSVLSILSIVASPFKDFASISKILPVSLSLAFTLVLTSNIASLAAYARAVVNFTAAASLLYLLMALQGDIHTQYGRYFYFGEGHPNLGSEINAMALILACIFYRGWALIARIPILAAPIVMMQGRAAIVAGAAAIGIHGLYSLRSYYRRYPAPTVLAVAIVVPAAVYLLYADIESVFSAMLLLDDPHRGLGTNLVGRNDRWEMAYEMILQRPFLGYGAAVYDQMNIETPHNFFLYGFVNLGVTFFAIIAFLAFFTVQAFRRAQRWTVILASTIVLMLLNDRFLNFAPYPFQLYVMLLSFAALPQLPRTARPMPRPAIA